MKDTRVDIPHTVENQEVKCNTIGIRHYQCLLMFFSILIFFIIRTSLSMAILEMTEEIPTKADIPTYPEWNNTDVILSSFFWGYILPQIGAGQLGEYFGPKWFLFSTMILGSIFQMLIPAMSASMGSSGVIICRFFQGLNQGFLYPSIQNLISRWTPLFERARITNFVYGGASLGTAIAMLLTGTLAGSNLGWPFAFYVTGGLGIAWAIIFALFAVNSPSTHRKISEREREYIQSTNSVTHDVVKEGPTPWSAIVKSLPMWAILMAGCAHSWGGYTLMTEIPSYLGRIMKLDIKSNSQLSSLPYFAQFFFTMVTSPIADKLVANKVLTLTTLRKIFGSMATFLPAAALICLAFIDNPDKYTGTILLVVAVGTTAFDHSGYLVNSIDIAPNHAGTLMGIVNSTSNIFSILAPITVGLFGNDKKDLILWKKVFLLAAGIYIAGGSFYAAFATGKLQPWNSVEKNRKSKRNSKRVNFLT